MKDFTRQETLALTEATSSYLAYLDRTGVVVPQKYGASKKPVVFYTWEQILIVRFVIRYKERFSPHTIRLLVEWLQTKLDISLDGWLAVADDDKIAWFSVGSRADMPAIVITPEFTKIINEIVKTVWESARKSQVIDFESFKARAKSGAD